MRFIRRTPWMAILAVVASCVPRPPVIAPLPSVVAQSHPALPDAELASGHTRLVFNWTLEEPDFSAAGEGVARVAAPDSARLDLFLSGGLGSGVAILVDSSLSFPGPDFLRRVIPSAPLLWASLGRLTIPAFPDTTIAIVGDTMRADFGKPIAWRATFVRDTLTELQRVGGDRILEWVARSNSTVDYRNESTRRRLHLDITRREPAGDFDAEIWSLRR